jgi:hypothetical protein
MSIAKKTLDSFVGKASDHSASMWYVSRIGQGARKRNATVHLVIDWIGDGFAA